MYIIRSKDLTIRGEFKCGNLPMDIPSSIYIGGKGDRHFFKGSISAMETYRTSVKGLHFPETLRQSIVSNQFIG